MIFPIIVLLSALLIEGIGTYISVIGLSTLFAANAIIIGLAVALDVAKLVTVSFLYKHWQKLGLVMRVYMTIAAIVLMTITSSGAFGYLSGQFQKAIAGSSQDAIIIQSLNEEKARLSARKVEIDGQIARLPDNSVNGRTQLMRQFGPEVGRINKRLEAIEAQLPQLKIESLKKNTEVGPIIYIATAFHTTPEEAVKWVILTIIFVFDPLAVALLIAANFLFELRREKAAELDEALKAFRPEHAGEFPTSATEIDAGGRVEHGAIHHEEDEPAGLWEHFEKLAASDGGAAHIAKPPAADEDRVTPTIELESLEVTTQEEQSAEIAAHPAYAKPTKAEEPVEQVAAHTHQEWLKILAAKPTEAAEPREVITKEQITGVKHRSTLEDVDGTRGDVEVQGTAHPIHNKALYGVYTESTPDAVRVGGPVGR